jgi:hypothetical protein
MKKKDVFTTVSLLLYSIFLFAQCHSSYEKKDFDNLMISIGKKDWRTIEVNEQMYNDTAFMEIYNHSQFYYDDVISFLKTDKFQDTLKYSAVSITDCIWAMQNLSLKQYVAFCDTIYSIYNSGKITNDELFEAISPDFGGKYILKENYKNADVIDLLRRINANQNISDSLRKKINEILSETHN